MKYFRPRKQKSGVVHYYFDAGGKPRKEIPLGSDYVIAVRKWSKLIGELESPVAKPDFEQLAKRYETEVMPTKAKSTQATQKGDLKMLREFFCNPVPAPLDEIRPAHIHQLLKWKSEHPTTANRLKRVFSHMFNMARAWDWTEKENPVTGIRGFSLAKREVDVSERVYKAVWDAGSEVVRDAMDLAYLTGQRPGDCLIFNERQIADSYFVIRRQNKTGRPLRIKIEGEFKALLERIQTRKDGYKLWNSNLLVNTRGMALTANVLRNHFEPARALAAKNNPAFADEIKAMWFYDLRAKAADDVSDERGEQGHDGDQAAADMLGHNNKATTQRHYLRRGKKVRPTR